MESYFYKTTNKINGKYYYGSGSKENYIGSGKLLKKAIDKYGLDNFKFEILKSFNDRKSAFMFEERFLKIFNLADDNMSYNLSNNGNGGNRIDYDAEDGDYYRNISKENITRWNKSDECRELASNRMFENNPMSNDDAKKKAVDALNKYRDENGSYWTDRNRSEETKFKISETRKLRKIPAWNKGLKIQKETECELCGRFFTIGGFKRHIISCKLN